MASVSVYSSSAKYVLGTKNFTLPTQDTGYLSAPPPQLCNYHDNCCQQRPDSVSSGKVRTMYLPVKAFSKHCSLLKGLCQNSPLSTPLVLPPRLGPPTLSVRAVRGLICLCRPRCQAPYIFGDRTGLKLGEAKT